MSELAATIFGDSYVQGSWQPARLGYIVGELVSRAGGNEARLAYSGAELVTRTVTGNSRLGSVMAELVTSIPYQELSAFTVPYDESWPST